MKVRYLLFSFTALLFLSACASKTAPVSSQTSQRESSAVEKESSAQILNKASWEIKWESALAAAKKEGKVVVYGSSPLPSINKAATQYEFSKKFGFVPEFMAGSGSQMSNKILTERRAGIYTTDVLIVGMNTFFGALKPAGVAEPLDSVLMLPEVVDPNLWYGGKLRWGDAEHMAFMPLAYTNLNIAINTELVKPGEIKSYYDLLNPKWKGKLLMNDPTIAGTGQKGFGVLGFKILDLEFFRQLARQEPVIMTDARLLVDWLAKGKYPVLVFPNVGSMQDYLDAGAPLAWVSAVEGSYISVAGANAVLVNKAPHPNAARVFINWYLSRDGQTLFSQNYGSQSARLDVSTEGLDPLKLRQPGAKYFLDADTEEWLARDPEFVKAAKDIFGPLMK